MLKMGILFNCLSSFDNLNMVNCIDGVYDTYPKLRTYM